MISLAFAICISYKASMDTPIRILGIAPYEGMKTMMLSLANQYPEIELSIFVGDLKQGVEIAKSSFHGNYDVLISRGGTAKMLQEQLPVPVVEVEFSAYDILCTLKLANGFGKKTAIISLASVSNDVLTLCRLVGYNLEVYQITDLDDIEHTLQQLQNRYEIILCDMVINTATKRLGIDSFLITSGIDSLRHAFDQALMLHRNHSHLRDENQFFRELLKGQINHTVVFDQDGTLFLSTLEDTTDEQLDLLRQELPEVLRMSQCRIVRNLRKILYIIRGKRIDVGKIVYVAFFFTTRKIPLIPNRAGIIFSSCSEIETAFFSSFFSRSNIVSSFQEKICHVISSNMPVFIGGEPGVGKRFCAYAVYLKSPHRNNPFVFIDCSRLNEKSRDFLLCHPDSPLSDEGYTLYFSHVNDLDHAYCCQLLAILSEMDVCQRNLVLFSCDLGSNQEIPPSACLFEETLCSIPIHLPPLRQTKSCIPDLVKLSINHLNANVPHQVAGIEADALTLLQEFPWPRNYLQFRRVISELVVAASSAFITLEETKQILDKEPRETVPFFSGVTAPSDLDLSQTLDKINRDIALHILNKTGGNQTATAKRLGISRTTLWRLLKNNKTGQ